MAEIKVKQTEKKIECREGENLLEALLGAGIYVDNPCNGKGICGKCKVRDDRGGGASAEIRRDSGWD